MSLERILFPDRRAAETALAGEIAALLAQNAAGGRCTVLGLATGESVTGLYRELVRIHREEGLELSGLTTFNLDELLGFSPGDEGSFHAFMEEHLFGPLGLPQERTHLPNGSLPPARIPAFCREYEEAIRAAGGIDLQVLGIGLDGHVGFNEPGSPLDSRTRRVTLAAATRRGRPWPGEAITMGVATILEARRIRMLAFGAPKAPIVRRLLATSPTPDLPATFLKEHPDARLLLDPPAAG